MILQALLQVLLNLEGQTMLEQARDFLTIVSMAITDREEVAVAQVEHVRVSQVGVLVDFIRIMRCDSSLRREGEFGDYVVNRVWVSCCSLLCW